MKYVYDRPTAAGSEEQFRGATLQDNVEDLQLMQFGLALIDTVDYCSRDQGV